MSRRSTKLAAGAAAGLLPFLLGQSPAAAATASDEESRTVVFLTPAGEEVTCTISGRHDVNTELQLEIALNVGSFVGDRCRGGLNLFYRYEDDGETQFGRGFAGDSIVYNASFGGVDSTDVAVDYGVVFSNCSANCEHSLSTQTK